MRKASLPWGIRNIFVRSKKTLEGISAKTPEGGLLITWKTLESIAEISYAFRDSLMSMSYQIALEEKNPEGERVLVEEKHLTEGFYLLVKELYDKLPKTYTQT